MQFVQPPGPPSHTLRLLIPSSAMLQQYALGYYLRQNILQFTHTPKFTEQKPENVFKDYSDEERPTPIPEGDVFLYNTPQQARGKGGSRLRGFAKKKNQKSRVNYGSGWVGPGPTRNKKLLGNHPKIALCQY